VEFYLLPSLPPQKKGPAKVKRSHPQKWQAMASPQGLVQIHVLFTALQRREDHAMSSANGLAMTGEDDHMSLLQGTLVATLAAWSRKIWVKLPHWERW